MFFFSWLYLDRYTPVSCFSPAGYTQVHTFILFVLSWLYSVHTFILSVFSWLYSRQIYTFILFVFSWLYADMFTPLSCLSLAGCTLQVYTSVLSSFSCILPSFSCILSSFSCSCILSSFSYILPPFSCICLTLAVFCLPPADQTYTDTVSCTEWVDCPGRP